MKSRTSSTLILAIAKMKNIIKDDDNFNQTDQKTGCQRDHLTSHEISMAMSLAPTRFTRLFILLLITTALSACSGSGGGGGGGGSGEPSSIPATPQNILAKLSSDPTKQITLSWGRSPGAASYDVSRRGGVEERQEDLPETGTKHVNNNVTKGQRYTYSVNACNNLGCSRPGSLRVEYAEPEFPLVAPTRLVAEDKVVLQWAPISGADYYNITRNGTVLVPKFQDPRLTSIRYEDESVNLSLNYNYTVSACNGVGCSAITEVVVNENTPSIFPPTGLTATRTSDSVNITWDAATNVTQYQVSRSGGFAVKISNTTASYTDSTPIAGSEYIYSAQVCVGDDNCSSRASIRVDYLVPDKEDIATGLTVAFAASLNAITIEWDAPPKGSGITLYQVARNVSVLATNVSADSNSYESSSYEDTNVTVGNIYEYKVSACNEVGCAVEAASIIVNYQVPNMPRNLVATRLSDRVVLQWDNVTEADYYNITRNGTIQGSNVMELRYEDTDVEQDGIYNYTVSACNIVGCSVPAAFLVDGDTPSIFPPVGLTATRLSDRIVIEWMQVEGVSHYNISRKFAGGSGILDFKIPNTTANYTDDNVTKGNVYIYNVQVCVDDSCSLAISITVNYQVPAASLVATDLTYTLLEGGVTLEWDATALGADVSYYQVTRDGSVIATNVNATSISRNSYTDRSVEVGKDYVYSISACNILGCSTELASITVIFEIPTPPSVTATRLPNPDRVVIQWSRIDGATHYMVSRDGVVLDANLMELRYEDTDVEQDGIYNYAISACNVLGCSVAAMITVDGDTPSISPPTGLTATRSPNRIDIEWMQVEGVSYYNISRRLATEDEDKERVLNPNIPNTSTNYQDDNVTKGNVYIYNVRACNQNECSSPSPIRVDYSIPTAAPDGLAFTRSPGAVTLEWDTPPKGSDITHYNVSRDGVVLNANIPIDPSGNSYEDETVEVGNDYVYTIRSCNDVGCSVNGGATRVIYRTPAIMPAGLSYDISMEAITLNWDATPSDADITHYQVARNGRVLNANIPIDPSGNSYEDETVEVDNTYVYSISACNDVGCSSPATITVDASTPPILSPAGLTATRSPTSVSLRWDESPDPSVTLYIVNRTGGGAITRRDGRATTNYIDTTVVIGNIYVYSISACKDINTCSDATTIEVVYQVPTTAPTGLIATRFSDSVTLEWDATALDADVSYYQVARNGSVIATNVPATNISRNSYTDTNVILGNSYDYTVSACNGVGCSDPSEGIEVVYKIPAASLVPTGLSFTRSPSAVTLEWNATALGADVSYYQVTRDGSVIATNVSATSTSRNSYTDTSVRLDNSYNYTVSACNVLGCSDPSEGIEVVYKTPAVPTGFDFTRSPDAITLEWNATALDADVSYYQVTRDDGSVIATNVSGTSYIDRNVIAGNIYKYSISACNDVGCSRPTSLLVDYSVPTSPFVAATRLSDRVVLQWGNVTEADYYQISRNGTIQESNVTELRYEDTDVVQGGIYNYTVSACNIVGCSVPAAFLVDGDTSSIFPPVGLTATRSPDSVTLRWTAATNITHYNISRRLATEDEDEERVLNSNRSNISTNYPDYNVTKGNVYIYSVRACNQNECSSPSLIRVDYFIPTAAPDGLAFTRSPSAVTLEWDTPPKGSGITHYQVTRDDGSVIATNVSRTNYIDRNVTAGNDYEYNVSACNEVGCAVEAASIDVIYRVPAPTIVPTGLIATRFSDSVTLQWNAPTVDTEIIRYNVKRVGSNINTNVSGTSYIDTNVTAGNDYEYNVSACNEVGCAVEAASIDVIYRVPAANLVPTDLTPTLLDGGVTLEWDATALGADVSYYQVTRDDGSVIAGNVGAGLTSYTDMSVILGNSYDYTVSACNEVGCSTELASITVIYRVPAANLVPTDLTYTLLEGGVTLEWNATADAVITHYRVTRSGTFRSIFLNTGTSYTDRSVILGTSYDYTVSACNILGCSTELASITVNYQVPNMPRNLVAARPMQNIVVLQWDFPPANSDVTHYNVSRDGEVLNAKIPLAGASYRDVVPTAQNANYNYTVSACNILGCSTELASITVDDNTPHILSPAGLTATRTTTSVILTWDSSRDDSISRYEVNRSGNTVNIDPISTTYEDIVSIGTTTTYEVRACNGPDETDCSLPASITVIYRAPAQPTNLGFTFNSTAVTFNWDAPATSDEVTYYRVTRDGGVATRIDNGTSYIDRNVTAGSIYEYSIRAHNDVGFSSDAIVDVPYQIPTTAPTGLIATRFSDSVTLRWNAPADAVITHYNVVRGMRVIEDNVPSIPAGTSYTDRFVRVGDSYNYRVSACNALGCSTELARIRVIFEIPPSPSVTATRLPNPDRAVLQWSPIDDATHYNVSRDGAVLNANLMNISYEDLTIKANQIYNYAISACNGVGCSDPDTIQVTDDTASILALTGVIATRSPTSVSLIWDASLDPSVTQYFVERTLAGEDRTSFPALSSTTTNYIDTSVVIGNDYEYSIIACKDIVTCSAATTIKVIYKVPTLLPRSSNVRSPDSVTLAWSNPDDDITHYNVTRNGVVLNANIPINPSGITRYEDTTAEDGNDYVYTIRSCNIVGCSVNGGATSVTYRTPAMPAGLSYNISMEAVTLQWDAAPSDADIDNYEVEQLGGGGNTLFKYDVLGSTSYEDTNVTKGNDYRYRVRACNIVGCSDPAVITAVYQVPATAPTNLVATTISRSSVTLLWDVFVASSVEISYKLNRVGVGVVEVNKTINDTNSYVDEGVEVGNDYNYTISACNIFGCSDPSEGIEVTYRIPTESPTVIATLFPAKIVLTWPKIDEGDYYEVSRDGSVLTTNIAKDIITYEDTISIPEGGSYTYTVGNCNDVGCAETELLVDENTSTLAVITDINATRNLGSVTLQWEASTESLLTRYEVRRDSTVIAGNVSAGLTNYTDTTVEIGNVYNYTVHACTGEECSGANLLRVDYRVPQAADIPTGLSSSAKSNRATQSGTSMPVFNPEATLGWDVAPEGSGITHYNITRDGSVLNANYRANSYRDQNSGLTLDNDYRYEVHACNILGCATTGARRTVVLRLIPETIESRPSNLRVTSDTKGEIKFTWDAATDAVRVKYYAIGSGGRIGETVEVTNTNIVNRVDGTSYTYRFDPNTLAKTFNFGVRGCNDLECLESSRYTATFTFNYKTPINRVEENSLNWDLSSNGITLGWDSVTSRVTAALVATARAATGYPEISYYKVKRVGSDLDVDVLDLSYEDTTVVAGTSYEYMVAACNIVGCSTATTSIIANYTAPTTSPDGLVATLGQRSISLVWNKATSAEITGYRVRRSNGLDRQIDDVDMVTYEDTDIPRGANANYTYTVSFCNVVGCADAGDTAVVEVKLPTGKPTGLVASLRSESIYLNWDRSIYPDTTSYNVKRGSSIDVETGDANANAYEDTSIASDVTASYTYTVNLCNIAGCATNGESITVAFTPDTDDSDGDGVTDRADVDEDGDGLIDISTVEGLNSIRGGLQGTSLNFPFSSSRSKGCGASGTEECSGYELITDIDLNDLPKDAFGSNWQPIGSCANDNCDGASELFSSSFEGNGYTISNLTINTEGKGVGLFGAVASGSSINNVHLRNVSINVPGTRYVGALVGFGNGIMINGSSAEINDIIGDQRMGGLIGSANNGRISSSSVVVKGAVRGRFVVGGLVGQAKDGSIMASSVAANMIDVSDRIGGGLAALAERTRIVSSYVVADMIHLSSMASGVVSEFGGMIGRAGRGGDAGIFSSTVIARDIGAMRTDGSATNAVGIGGLVGGVNPLAGGPLVRHGVTVGASYALYDILRTGQYGGGLTGWVTDKISVKYTLVVANRITAKDLNSGHFFGRDDVFSQNGGPRFGLFGSESINSYWDSRVSGGSRYPQFGATGRLTSALQNTIDFTGIYENWGGATCNPTTGEYRTSAAAGFQQSWDLGAANEYPALSCLLNFTPAQQREVAAAALANTSPFDKYLEITNR